MVWWKETFRQTCWRGDDDCLLCGIGSGETLNMLMLRSLCPFVYVCFVFQMGKATPYISLTLLEWWDVWWRTVPSWQLLQGKTEDVFGELCIKVGILLTTRCNWQRLSCCNQLNNMLKNCEWKRARVYVCYMLHCWGTLANGKTLRNRFVASWKLHNVLWTREAMEKKEVVRHHRPSGCTSVPTWALDS